MYVNDRFKSTRTDRQAVAAADDLRGTPPDAFRAVERCKCCGTDRPEVARNVGNDLANARRR
jgi:hypothetical protein